MAVAAIVNAANELMLGWDGVDCEIRAMTGKELFNACLNVQEVRPRVRCLKGEVRITPGFFLTAKFGEHERLMNEK